MTSSVKLCSSRIEQKHKSTANGLSLRSTHHRIKLLSKMLLEGTQAACLLQALSHETRMWFKHSTCISGLKYILFMDKYQDQ